MSDELRVGEQVLYKGQKGVVEKVSGRSATVSFEEPYDGKPILEIVIGELMKAVDTGNLTPQQLMVLPYLSAGIPHTQAAKLAGLGRTTVYQWLHEPNFAEQYMKLRKAAFEVAVWEMRGLVLKATHGLAELMESPDERIRLGAIQTVLNHGNRPMVATVEGLPRSRKDRPSSYKPRDAQAKKLGRPSKREQQRIEVENSPTPSEVMSHLFKNGEHEPQ